MNVDQNNEAAEAALSDIRALCDEYAASEKSPEAFKTFMDSVEEVKKRYPSVDFNLEYRDSE